MTEGGGEAVEVAQELLRDLRVALRATSPRALLNAGESTEVVRLAARTREALQEAAVATPEAAAAADVEDLLWRNVYYKRIEVYRRALKAAGDDRRCRGALLHFLDAAREQYEAFRTRLAQRRAIAIASQDPHVQASSRLLLLSEHRCQICLGDLARYREIYTSRDPQQSAFAVAERAYSAALDLVPTRGNPHNQLAVLEQYRGNICLALYRYVRSIDVVEPFVTGEKNVELLLEVVRKQFTKKQLLEAMPAPASGPMTSAERTTLLRNSLLRFVHCIGLLVTRNYWNGTSDRSITDLVRRLTRELAKEFEILIRKSAIKKHLQIALIVCCIFAVQRCSQTGNEVRNALAEDLAFMTVAVMAEMSLSSGPEVVSIKRAELLMPISVFLRWIRARTGSNAQIPVDVGRQYASRLWTAVGEAWATLVDLAEGLEQHRDPAMMNTDREQLWEDVELRGYVYIPTLAVNKHFCEDKSIVAGKRAETICSFCDWLSNEFGMGDTLPFEAHFVSSTTQQTVNDAAMSSAAILLDDDHGDSSSSWPEKLNTTSRSSSGPHRIQHEEEDDEVIVLAPNVRKSSNTSNNSSAEEVVRKSSSENASNGANLHTFGVSPFNQSVLSFPVSSHRRSSSGFGNDLGPSMDLVAPLNKEHPSPTKAQQHISSSASSSSSSSYQNAFPGAFTSSAFGGAFGPQQQQNTQGNAFGSGNSSPRGLGWGSQSMDFTNKKPSLVPSGASEFLPFLPPSSTEMQGDLRRSPRGSPPPGFRSQENT